jgi:hypothetical protein
MKNHLLPEPQLQNVHGQPSWRFASKEVDAFVTERGGHLGPVTFHCGHRRIQPYSIAPWAEEKVDPATPSILKVLRGDFFCMPFGGNARSFHHEEHPVHGETANAKWTFESLEVREGRTCLHLSLKTKIRRGRVDKRLFVENGHSVMYCQHQLSGFAGPMNLGHHAMLKFPAEPGSGRISTSPIVLGQVCPEVFERPEKGGRSALKIGAEFASLDRVPLEAGNHADLTIYPARQGFEDLVMVVSDADVPFAWTTATFPKEQYLWFALKNQRILRQTVFWISNGGRSYEPWNSRHTGVLGIEDVTSYFHFGLAEASRKNPISDRGFPTHLELDPLHPLVVPYIMGVAPIPPGFDRVVAVEGTDDGVIFRSASGKEATATVELDFLNPEIHW